MSKDELQKLISDDKIKEALTELEKQSKNNPPLSFIVASFQNRFTRIEKERIKRTEDKEYLDIAHNRLVNSILKYIDNQHSESALKKNKALYVFFSLYCIIIFSFAFVKLPYFYFSTNLNTFSAYFQLAENHIHKSSDWIESSNTKISNIESISSPSINEIKLNKVQIYIPNTCSFKISRIEKNSNINIRSEHGNLSITFDGLVNGAIVVNGPVYIVKNNDTLFKKNLLNEMLLWNSKNGKTSTVFQVKKNYGNILNYIKVKSIDFTNRSYDDDTPDESHLLGGRILIDKNTRIVLNQKDWLSFNKLKKTSLNIKKYNKNLSIELNGFTSRIETCKGEECFVMQKTLLEYIFKEKILLLLCLLPIFWFTIKKAAIFFTYY